MPTTTGIVMDSWTDFKDLVAAKQLAPNYVEYPFRYEVYIADGALIWSIELAKGSDDAGDFEDNYQSLSNRPSFFAGQFRNKYRNITGNTTVTVKSGNGVIRGISINANYTGGTVTVYDNTAGSGTKISTLQLATPSGGLLSTTGLPSPTYITMAAEFSTGLTVVTAGSSNNDITIYYV